MDPSPPQSSFTSSSARFSDSQYGWDGARDCPAPDKLSEDEKRPILKETDECPACLANSKLREKEEEEKRMEEGKAKERKGEEASTNI